MVIAGLQGPLTSSAGELIIERMPTDCKKNKEEDSFLEQTASRSYPGQKEIGLLQSMM